MIRIAAAVVVAGLGTWRRTHWALPLAAFLAIVSILACVLGLREAVAGVVINAIILVIVAWASLVQPARTRPTGVR